MARIIEAEARISAIDATGRTFEQIAQKVKGVQSAFKALSGVSASGVGNINRTLGHIQRMVHTLAPAAAGAAAMEGARGLSGLMHETIKIAVERAHEAVRMNVAGFSEQELSEAERISQEVSERNKALSTTTIMHSLRNLRTIVGSFDEAAKLIDPIAKLRIVTLGAHPERKAELEGAFDKLEKSQEMVGATQDPARFRRNMDLVAKAMNTFGDTLRPDDFYDFTKYARQAGQGYSDHFLLGVAPTLMQEMSGKSAGEAMSSLFQQFVAGRMPVYAAQLAGKYGLIGDPSKIEYNNAGKIHRLEPGAIKGFELAKSDPYRWINEVYLPALAAHGVTTKEDIANVTATMAGKRTTGQAMGIFATQGSRIEKDLAMTAGAKGLESAETFVSRDPMMAWEGVTEQFKNLLAVAGGPLAEPAAAGLNLLADGIVKLEQAASGHPVAGAAGLAAALGLGGWGTWIASKTALGGLGNLLRGAGTAVTDLSPDAAIKAMQSQLPEATAAGSGAGAMIVGGGVLAGGFALSKAAADQAFANPAPYSALADGGMLGAMAPFGYAEAGALAKGDGKRPPDLSLADVHAALGGQAAEVKGSADLNVNVQVEPSDSFISRIETVLRNSINAFGAGAVAPGSGVGTAGSTGLSMPEAVPPR